MKNLILLLVVTVLFSCSKDSTKYTLSGTAQGIDDGTKVMVYTISDNQTKVLDTLTISNEKFSGTFDIIEEASINYLVVNNSSILFFPENDDLTATIYKDSIQSSFITGNQQNDNYRSFNQNLKYFINKKKENSQAYQKAAKNQDSETARKIQQDNVLLTQKESIYKNKFVKENPNSLFALMLVSEMLNSKQINAVEAGKLVEGFNPKIAENSIAKEIKKIVKNIKKSDVGGKAPAFSAKTPQGKDLALADVMGKYTIIDFWASWCRPCRAENPNVVRVYEEFHDKGLNIISVSLDKAGQESRWKQAIEKDKMDWHHVSNLKGWKEPIAQQYSVRSIPATFLIDENGIIVAKNLRGPALGKKIGELLNQ